MAVPVRFRLRVHNLPVRSDSHRNRLRVLNQSESDSEDAHALLSLFCFYPSPSIFSYQNLTFNVYLHNFGNLKLKNTEQFPVTFFIL